MNCKVIQDLLPLYIDDVVSEESVALVEGHLKECDDCTAMFRAMKNEQPTIPVEVEKAVAPFKKINRKRRLQVVSAILVTLIISIIGMFVVQDVAVVNEIFFPRAIAVVRTNEAADEWQMITFNNQETFTFDSIFWEKKIVNDTNSEASVLLRVKDEFGTVVVDETIIPAGQSIELDSLERDKEYLFEVKVPEGTFFLNAV